MAIAIVFAKKVVKNVKFFKNIYKLRIKKKLLNFLHFRLLHYLNDKWYKIAFYYNLKYLKIEEEERTTKLSAPTVLQSQAPQCASYRRVRLRSVHHTVESDSAVCIAPHHTPFKGSVSRDFQPLYFSMI